MERCNQLIILYLDKVQLFPKATMEKVAPFTLTINWSFKNLLKGSPAVFVFILDRILIHNMSMCLVITVTVLID